MTVWTGALPALLAGDVPPASDWKQILDALRALTDAWSSYTPSWTSSGTQPVINDGTLESRYLQAGHLVHYSGRMLAGSTTTFGTGNYDISLPVTSASSNRYLGSALFLDGTSGYVGIARMDGTTNLRFYATGTTSQVGATVPFTFGSGDQIIWNVTYEPA